MKYVALLSGGKDSCFNLLHCQQNGHELVAAASLRPEQGKEELDSYLYQTVGQDAIEFVARALEVPLYRGVIIGNAVEQGPEYGTRTSKNGVDGDETEDLYHLLTTVKSHHPEVQGVSVGAILSNYQRVRVEHVCHRLSLTCLCYLWQRNQAELLSEMIEAGMEAVLIKVAGIGLNTKHLGKSLAQMQPTLTKLNDLYGSHICGEGGEYESLTLDCPLFKSRIILTDTEIVIHSDNDFATVAYLRIKDARLELKTRRGDYALASIPPPLEDVFDNIRQSLLEDPANGDPEDGSIVNLDFDFPTDTRRNNQWIAVSNIQVQGSAEKSIEDEVQQCFRLLQERLFSYGLTLAHIVHINLFLASMDDFVSVNAVYASFFGASPPSRATVALDLSPGLRVRLDCLAFTAGTDNHQRHALHVQSQSYWAPANIGPYSQAILTGERLSMSGQIGLIPSSITLPSPRSLATEAALSMQHVHRVIAAMRNGWEGHTQLAIYWLNRVAHIDAVRRAINAYDQVSVKLFVAVNALPKGAMIEKQVSVHTGRVWMKEEDAEHETEPEEALTPKTLQSVFEQGNLECGNLSLHWETSQTQTREAKDSDGFALICLRCGGGECVDEDVRFLGAQLKVIPLLQHYLSEPLLLRVFYAIGSVDQSTKSLIRSFLKACFVTLPPVTSIPSRAVATRAGDVWDFGILMTK